MSISLTFSYIHYFQLRGYGMCGSMLVYKTYLACHKEMYMSKGHAAEGAFILYLPFSLVC